MTIIPKLQTTLLQTLPYEVQEWFRQLQALVVTLGGGTVTSVSVTTAAGVSGSVATPTVTPAITITLGAITPTSVAASGTVTGSNLSGTHSGTSSGTNTGDQTTVSGNAGTATALQNARTIGGVSFNGTANITVASATGGFAVTGALTATTTVSTGGYTVATLPAGVTGARAYVTDALAPTFLAAVVGGGAITTPVFYNGAAWVGG